MVRWEPDARGRLRAAALELFVEQGFERTTVAQIAERAGLNRRTFFHHFADKREVVFAGQEGDDEQLLIAVRDQPGPADPLAAALAGLKRVVAEPSERFREGAVQVGAIIAASPELRERELAKRGHLAGVLAAALRERGVAGGAAEVTGWAAVAVFFVARNRWNRPGNQRTLAAHLDGAAAEFVSSSSAPSSAG